MAAAVAPAFPNRLAAEADGEDAQGQTLRPADIHVLLVDDDKVARLVVGNLLRKCEYRGTNTLSQAVKSCWPSLLLTSTPRSCFASSAEQQSENSQKNLRTSPVGSASVLLSAPISSGFLIQA